MFFLLETVGNVQYNIKLTGKKGRKKSAKKENLHWRVTDKNSGWFYLILKYPRLLPSKHLPASSEPYCVLMAKSRKPSNSCFNLVILSLSIILSCGRKVLLKHNI